MSNLIDFYELSLWQDILQSDGTFKEQRLMVIGSSEMECQNRALDIRLVNGINGSHNLSFKMYYRYKDNVTGETVDNIFTSYITNESKLKLYHKNKWYDLIVKTITKNSTDNSFTYSAVDYHINELSKNGFGLTLDTQLQNNIGTVKELGTFIMKDTDWKVDADPMPQTLEESLVEVKLTPQEGKQAVAAKKIDDSNMAVSDVNLTFSAGDKIYFFYSCLKNQTPRLQFIYIPKDLSLAFDQNKIITNKNCQYYIDNATYSVDTDFSAYGLSMPTILDMTNRTVTISSYRGNRYVFSKKIEYNALLDKYVTACTKGAEEWYRYEETTYEAPILVENFITNTDFASPSGWTGHYISPVNGDNEITVANQQSQYGAKVEAKTSPDVVANIINGTYDSNKTVTPYLSTQFFSNPNDNINSVLLNSGFQDNKRKLQEIFSPGQKFVARCDLIKGESNIQKIKVIIAKSSYHVMENCYTMPKESDIFLKFVLDASANGLASVEAEVAGSGPMTDIKWKATTLQVYIFSLDTPDKNVLQIKNLEIFKYVPVERDQEDKEDSGKPDYLTPEDSSTKTKTITNYYYFNKSENANFTSKDQMIIYKRNTPRTDIVDIIDAKAEKMVTLSVQKSNYFNAVQSLCEAAECWVDFEVTHNENGEITGKKVWFKRYVGQDNYAGFRYGVNLNSISRQVVSTAIVTKLIVPDNMNQHADNGFCSIVRAKSNEIGENYIYDFSYYLNTKMLDYNTFHIKMYSTDNAVGEDIDKNDTTTNYFGYYTRLSALNQRLDEIDAQIANYQIPLTEAKAQLKTYENGRKAAEEELTSAAADFLKLTGFEYTAFNEDTDEKWKDNSDVNKYITEIATQIVNMQEFSIKENSAKNSVSTYEGEIQKCNTQRDKIIKQKRALNLAFYKVFARFIQEGTWQDSAAIDDEKYFIDARATAYNSSHPQVSYTINVVNLAGLPGYELFDFQLGDQTWMEDEEYFGVDDNGNPIRENITITEINYALDDPSATTIKVQNFRNQFQDLFQKITASVQQVNYSSGVWDNAGSFTEADPDKQAKFLQDALNSAELIIQNAGNQSVLQNDDGITVTDLTSPNKQVRITGGAILLSDQNAGGESIWKVGLTAQGINAGIINAGTINTNNIQIMNGNEPYFRWDSYGITAYDFTLNDAGVVSGYKPQTGVRFDRFGLYGFKDHPSGNGANWHPKNLKEIREQANFSLTWDGLEIESSNKIYKAANEARTEVKHGGGLVTKLGRVDDNIYNDWNAKNIPIYDESKKGNKTFVKVFSVGDSNDNEELVIYDDGTLTANKIKLTQSIEWTEASSPSKSVYATSAYVNKFKPIEQSVPANKTSYSSFPDSDGGLVGNEVYVGWHKVASQNDSYYVHTDNGGATWQGPFLITGKSIVNTVVEYKIDTAGKDPASVTSWSTSYPTSSPDAGQSLYIRMYDVFNNGDPSTYRYSVGGGQGATGPAGPGAINCYVESLSGNLFNENTTGEITLTARIFQGDKEIDPITTDNTQQLNYTWYINGIKDTSLTTKQIKIAFSNIKNKSIYFEAE